MISGVDEKGQVERVVAKVPVVFAKGEMQVKVGSLPHDLPRYPSQALSGALKMDSKSKKFRVSWGNFGAGYGFNSTVLYNRINKTLKYFRSGYSRGNGTNGGDFNSGGEYIIRYSLVDVTDKMVHQLATSNKGETQASGPLGPLDLETAGFTKYITKYGARIISAKIRA